MAAWFGKPAMTTQQALEQIPADEREALGELCQSAELEVDDLRHIASYSGGIFNYPANTYSFVVQDGHVVACCIRERIFSVRPDLVRLPALIALNLKGSTIPDWPITNDAAKVETLNLGSCKVTQATEPRFPESVIDLDLSNGPIVELNSLSQLKALRKLNLSDTKVQDIEPLMSLSLDELTLVGTRITALPSSVPKSGEWMLDLRNTPITTPAGYRPAWPFPTMVSTAPSNDVTFHGVPSRKEMSVDALIPAANSLHAYDLPRCTDANIGEVKLTASCSKGKVRIWLEEPSSLFSGPWFDAGKVKSYGAMRARGYVSALVTPAGEVALVGRLRLNTESRYYEQPSNNRSEATKQPDWCHYGFFVEPLDAQGAESLKIHFETVDP